MEHLTPEQIEQYVTITEDTGPGTITMAMEEHLAACEDCCGAIRRCAMRCNAYDSLLRLSRVITVAQSQRVERRRELERKRRIRLIGRIVSTVVMITLLLLLWFYHR